MGPSFSGALALPGNAFSGNAAMNGRDLFVDSSAVGTFEVLSLCRGNDDGSGGSYNDGSGGSGSDDVEMLACGGAASGKGPYVGTHACTSDSSF